ncbi:hypothetical protein FO519_004527 [Halicephalobus sp. NKZ332]|nr:hypothetical protein FO519_004527 [Halicephalobus sp. NKZ332]
METPGEALQVALKDSEFYQQLFSQYRLQTFKKWPFDPKSAKAKTKHKCTSDLLAKVGYVHDSDCSAYCVFCGKTLEFESEDDPAEEHKAHSPNCVFLNLMETPEENWTMDDIKPLLSALLLQKATEKLRTIRDELNNQISKAEKRISPYIDIENQ